MKKTLFLIIVILALQLSSALAFVYEGDLGDSLSIVENIYVGEEITLLPDQAGGMNFSVSPEYFTDELMYLMAGDEVYVARDIDLLPVKEGSLSEGIKAVKYEGNYKNSGNIIAYSDSKIFFSVNRGDTWFEIAVNSEEEILCADFIPNFSVNNSILVATSNKLYRKSLKDYSETVLLEDDFGEIRAVYSSSGRTDLTQFYVLKNDSVLRTDNGGGSWVEIEFDSKIKNFLVMPGGLYGTSAMLSTEDGKLYFSSDGISFIESVLPAGSSKIYKMAYDEDNGNFVYLILTDKGIFVSNKIGGQWAGNSYVVKDFSKIDDIDVILGGSQTAVYMIEDGTLIRDMRFTGVFEDYMGGLDLSSGYASSGTAVSKNILDLHEEQFAEEYKVAKATLVADGDLNGGTMEFYMTADGTNWEAVMPGVEHVFATPGRDLRWKVEMSTSDTSKTPVLRDVSVNFGMDSGCAGFTDVAVDDPYCPAIEYVRAQGIFSGYPDGTFGADLEINRAETVKVITEGFDYAILKDNGTNLGFSDVEVGSWYMGYLNTAKTAGIIEGYPDGTFKPADTVNYVEMMKIFLETAEADLVEPATGEWYQKYVNYATANGLTVYENLDAGMKRADVAQLFYDYLPGNSD